MEILKGMKGEVQAAAKRTTQHSRPQLGLPNHLPDSHSSPPTSWNRMLRILDLTAAFGEHAKLFVRRFQWKTLFASM